MRKILGLPTYNFLRQMESSIRQFVDSGPGQFHPDHLAAENNNIEDRKSEQDEFEGGKNSSERCSDKIIQSYIGG